MSEDRPVSPVCDKPIEVSVVGRRCVYVNNYRIAGGKPYVSEGLPSHEFTTTIGEVIDAFTPEDIRAALKERDAYRKWLRARHATMLAKRSKP